MVGIIQNRSIYRKLTLLIILHILVCLFLWVFSYNNSETLDCLLASVHFIFSATVLFLLIKHFQFYSVKVLIVCAIVFLILNTVPNSSNCDILMGKLYTEGYGWPFVFYEYSPIILEGNVELEKSQWLINNLFCNVYISSVFVAFLMLFFDKKMNRITKAEKTA